MTTTNSQPTPQKVDAKASLKQLETTLEEYLVKKAPFTIPPGAKEFIVNFSPWITLVVMILALPAVLAVFGLGTLLMPFSYLGGMRYGVGYMLGLILTGVAIVMEAMAVPGLFKRAKSAWYLVYYSTLVIIVHDLISFNIGGAVISGLISLYILFQVKEYYK